MTFELAFKVEAVQGLDNLNLSALIEVATQELKRRAREAADPQALIEQGFKDGFTSRGEPRRPWLEAGILICPGWLANKSALNHNCSFVRVANHWVWESPDKVYDDVRNIPGPQRTLRSVTLIAVTDGVEVDQVQCRTKNSVHEMQRVTSYVVTGEQLEVVSTRTPSISRAR